MNPDLQCEGSGSALTYKKDQIIGMTAACFRTEILEKF